MKLRAVLAGTACILLPLAVFGELLPAGEDYDAYAADGTTHIGDLDVSSSGNVLVFNDDPATSHPPDTNVSYVLNSAGTGYTNNSGHTVFFTSVGSGEYTWEKKNASGQVVDSGSIIPE